MKNKKNILKVILCIIIFSISLYLVEFSPYSSKGIEEYNGGYGTFDMKDYDNETVYGVLDNTTYEGFSKLKIYYAYDFLFIAVFGTIQVMLSVYILNFIKSKYPGRILSLIAIIRGIADFIENCLLIKIIFSYPVKQDFLIQISSHITKVKLFVIPLWVILFIVAGIIRMVYCGKKK